MAILDALGQYATNRFNNAITGFGNRMDQMGQYITDPQAALQRRLAEEEEERQRREREQQMMAEMEQRQRDMQAANTAVKQTIVTQPDGSQEMTIKGTPQALSGMNPNTPTVTGPAIPNVMGQQATQDQQAAAAMDEQRRLREQQAAQQRMQQQAPMATAPVAPVAPEPLSQDEILREQEQRRQYQQMMARPAVPTAPAPAPAAAPTAQAAPSQPISPAQQAAGQGAQPVVRFGQPIPTAENAPEAAPTQMAQAATGTRTDVTAPTTGAITTPQAITPDALQRQMEAQDIQEGAVTRQVIADRNNAQFWMDRIQASQRDTAEMERMARDPNIPEQWRRVAASQSAMSLEEQRKMQEAEQQARDIMAKGGKGLQKALAMPNEKGSYLKAYMFARFGLTDLARAEQAKLTTTWQRVFDDEGNPAFIQVRGTGLPIRGIDSQGEEIPTERLTAFATGTGEALRPVVGVGTVEKEINGKIVRGRVVTAIQNGQTRTYVESGGKRYAYSGDWKDTSISTAAEKAVAQKEINLAYDPIIAAAKSGAEFLGKFNAEHGTNFAIQGYDTNRNPIVVDQNTNQVIQKSNTGVVTATTTRSTAPRGTTPADIVSARETQRTTSDAFIKINADNASKQADKASAAPGLLSAIDNIIRQTDERPQFFNAMQTPAYRAFAAAQGPEAAARLKELSDAVRIPEKERPRFNQLMNDIKRLELAGITSSGLTASQLNTERESQRVVNAFAVNTSDSPQAARIQAEIARAQVVYQREFARFLGRADPTQNPARIRTQFDEQIGDKIWTDLYPKLEAIQRGGVVDFRSNQ